MYIWLCVEFFLRKVDLIYFVREVYYFILHAVQWNFDFVITELLIIVLCFISLVLPNTILQGDAEFFCCVITSYTKMLSAKKLLSPCNHWTCIQKVSGWNREPSYNDALWYLYVVSPDKFLDSTLNKAALLLPTSVLITFVFNMSLSDSEIHLPSRVFFYHLFCLLSSHLCSLKDISSSTERITNMEYIFSYDIFVMNLTYAYWVAFLFCCCVTHWPCPELLDCWTLSIVQYSKK